MPALDEERHEDAPQCRKLMGAARGALVVASALALAIALAFAGLLACMVPSTTRILARATSLDDLSPYTRDELVDLADEGRSYAFGAHDARRLEDAQKSAQAALVASGRYTAEGLSEAIERAPAMFELTSDAISHLDDCHRVIGSALPWLAGDAALAACLLIACGTLGRRRALGAALAAGGAMTLLALAGLGLWIAIDFDAFFETFHGLFFQAGTWKFPYDSLLICMYPEAFWAGMAVVWAAVSASLSLVCVIAGLRLMRRLRG